MLAIYPSKMLSFAGLEPGYFQSGQSEFTGHMVKHGLLSTSLCHHELLLTSYYARAGFRLAMDQTHVEETCEWCGEKFTDTSGQGRRYCSRILRRMRLVVLFPPFDPAGVTAEFPLTSRPPFRLGGPIYAESSAWESAYSIRGSGGMAGKANGGGCCDFNYHSTFLL